MWHSSTAREVRRLVWINTWVDGRSASGIVACMNPANHPVPGHRFSINDIYANCSRKSLYVVEHDRTSFSNLKDRAVGQRED
jgi:citrate lyase synthetase